MSSIGAIRGGPAAPRRTARAGGGFALPATSARPDVSGASAASGIAALLAVQEDGRAATPPAERARRRGRAALDELRRLQLDLLRGGADPARLARLAALAEPAELDDPDLRAVLDDIALRVKIEHARQRMALARRAGALPA